MLHLRGCSGEPNRLPPAYHSGETDDLAFLVRMLRAHEPHMKIAVVGYSRGGNVLLKWLGEAGVEAAIGVCVRLSLDVAAQRYEPGLLARLSIGADPELASRDPTTISKPVAPFDLVYGRGATRRTTAAATTGSWRW